MAKAKRKKTKADEAREFYLANLLTPEEKAAARAELQREVERARAEGVYERIIAVHEQRVRERAGVSMLHEGEPRKKR
jgi:hypothetical protein